MKDMSADIKVLVSQVNSIDKRVDKNERTIEEVGEKMIMLKSIK